MQWCLPSCTFDVFVLSKNNNNISDFLCNTLHYSSDRYIQLKRFNVKFHDLLGLVNKGVTIKYTYFNLSNDALYS